MVAIPFRMQAGFPGDVNRLHPAVIEPCVIDASAPPTSFGIPVVIDSTTEGARPIVAGDSGLTSVYGFTVRPFPFQAATQSGNFGQANFGVASPISPGVIDVLRLGYIMAILNGGAAAAAVVKGGPVFVYYGVTSGVHIQGGIEPATGSNILALDSTRYFFNGPADALGNVEIYVR